MGLYWDNGKYNGSCYSILGVYIYIYGILRQIMENQMEKKMENEMETGIVNGYIDVLDFRYI